MVSLTLGSVTFTLKEKFDFSFLPSYGQPFAVFDDQDSGNLCMGVQGERGKLFLKIAGAATVRSQVTGQQAMERLRANVPIYRDLCHPALIELLEERPIPGGHVLVFPWFDGVCMGRQYPTHTLFGPLPFEEKLGILDTILEFHEHVHRNGYVAIDFYDGSVMYDLVSHRTMICDIEFYSKKPYVNAMGRLWGSSRFMSPEEFQMGAAIDERSNVFCMGAMAFHLFGGGADRSAQRWAASRELFAVAAKATSPDPALRYATIAQLREEWNRALRGA